MLILDPTDNDIKSKFSLYSSSLHADLSHFEHNNIVGVKIIPWFMGVSFQAYIAEGDVITHLDGAPLVSSTEVNLATDSLVTLRQKLGLLLPGDTIKLGVVRNVDHRVEDVVLELGAVDIKSSAQIVDPLVIRGIRSSLGLSVSNVELLNKEVATKLLSGMSPSVGFILTPQKNGISVSKLSPAYVFYFEFYLILVVQLFALVYNSTMY